MKKMCEKCGKVFDGCSWEKLCFTCTKEKNLKRIQDEIKNAEPDEPVDTWSSDYVICPYCGYAMDTDLSYQDFREIYEEGSHKIQCPDCERHFVLETSVSYSWETEKLYKRGN